MKQRISLIGRIQHDTTRNNKKQRISRISRIGRKQHVTTRNNELHEFHEFEGYIFSPPFSPPATTPSPPPRRRGEVTPPSKSYSTLQELLHPPRVTPPSKSYSALQELLLPPRVTPPSKSYSVVRRRCFGVVISLPSFSKGVAGVVCKKTVPTSFLLPPFSLSSSRVKPFCINSCRCCVAH